MPAFHAIDHMNEDIVNLTVKFNYFDYILGIVSIKIIGFKQEKAFLTCPILPFYMIILTCFFINR